MYSWVNKNWIEWIAKNELNELQRTNWMNCKERIEWIAYRIELNELYIWNNLGVMYPYRLLIEWPGCFEKLLWKHFSTFLQRWFLFYFSLASRGMTLDVFEKNILFQIFILLFSKLKTEKNFLVKKKFQKWFFFFSFAFRKTFLIFWFTKCSSKKPNVIPLEASENIYYFEFL